jgi:hypothetical protein
MGILLSTKNKKTPCRDASRHGQKSLYDTDWAAAVKKKTENRLPGAIAQKHTIGV